MGQILRLKLSKLRDTYESYRLQYIPVLMWLKRYWIIETPLLTRFGEIPKLFILKFDMKECYDRLSQPVLTMKTRGTFRKPR